jgi:hypothetical protein
VPDSGGWTVRARSTTVPDSGDGSRTARPRSTVPAMAGRRTTPTVPAEPVAHVRHHPHPPARHPLYRHPREGGDPGLPPCEERRQNGHRPGRRGRRRVDRGVVANGHRSFLWKPTWIPAFAGMTVFSLYRDGRRWCRTAAVAVGRCGRGQSGAGQRRLDGAGMVDNGAGQRRWQSDGATTIDGAGHGGPADNADRSRGTRRPCPTPPPPACATPPLPSSPRKATVSPHAGRMGRGIG